MANCSPAERLYRYACLDDQEVCSLRDEGRGGGLDRPRPDELAGFRRIQSRRRAVWIVWLTFLPAFGLFYHCVGSPLVIGWTTAFFVSGIIQQLSRCPRCGNRCFWKGWFWKNTWAPRCLHCRVRLDWSDTELAPMSLPGSNKTLNPR